MRVWRRLMPLLKNFNPKGERHLVSERIHYQRQAIALIWQSEGCNLTQASLDCSTCRHISR